MSESEATSVRTGDIVKSDGTTLFVIAGPNDQVWLVNPNYYGPVYVLHAKKGFDYRLPEGYTIVRRADASA